MIESTIRISISEMPAGLRVSMCRLAEDPAVCVPVIHGPAARLGVLLVERVDEGGHVGVAGGGDGVRRGRRRVAGTLTVNDLVDAGHGPPTYVRLSRKYCSILTRPSPSTLGDFSDFPALDVVGVRWEVRRPRGWRRSPRRSSIRSRVKPDCPVGRARKRVADAEDAGDSAGKGRAPRATRSGRRQERSVRIHESLHAREPNRLRSESDG